jgi:alpha-mannosidase
MQTLPKLTPKETELRNRLHIPLDANPVVVFDSTSHNDWDWYGTFDVFYEGDKTFNSNCPWQIPWGYGPNPGLAGPSRYEPIKEIFKQAAQILNAENKYIPNDDPLKATYPSHYSICEIAYLKRFVEEFGKDSLPKENLHIVGGGITSPSIMLPTGESILRNQLAGFKWVTETFGMKSRYAWLPDTFTFHPDLPILYQAMGLSGLGFGRIGGAFSGIPDTGPLPNSPAAALVKDQTTAFIWQADDGSKIFATWLSFMYAQVSNLWEAVEEEKIEKACSNWFKYFPNQPYLYVPVCDDNVLPVGRFRRSSSDAEISTTSSLTNMILEWNKQNYVLKDGKKPWAVVASFEDFADLVRDSEHPVRTYKSLVTGPEWTGYFASCPDIKRQHVSTSADLISAEAFSSLLWMNAYNIDSIDKLIGTGWEKLTPSTHHAYVTGCSSRDVYVKEQRPLIQDAANDASKGLADAASSIAQNVAVSKESIVVFNPLGFDVEKTLVEMSGEQPDSLKKNSKVQITNDGSQRGYLFLCDTVPSLGYKTIELGPDSFISPLRSSQVLGAGGNYLKPGTKISEDIYMANQWISAKFKWDGKRPKLVDILYDTKYSRSLFGLDPEANEFLFYSDADLKLYEKYKSKYPSDGTAGGFLGDVFQFYYERDWPTKDEADNRSFSLLKVFDYASNCTAEVIESGPLRSKVRIVASIKDPLERSTQEQKLIIEYTLVADEKQLRVKAEFAAPDNFSVFTRLPFRFTAGSGLAKPTRMVSGTAYHRCQFKEEEQKWRTQVQKAQGPNFYASQNFVVPYNNAPVDTPIAAVYHKGVQCWGTTWGNYNDRPQIQHPLIACLWRNVPLQQAWFWAPNIDPDTHEVEYAIRIPSLNDFAPETGIQYRESMSFQNPSFGILQDKKSGQKLATTDFAVRLNDKSAVVTTAKISELNGDQTLILRIYNPKNVPLPLKVTLGRSAVIANITAISALERPLPIGECEDLAIVHGSDTPNEFSFTAKYAITTLAINLKRS